MGYVWSLPLGRIPDMCGIFGLVAGADMAAPPDSIRDAMSVLFRLSESRGKEASGDGLNAPPGSRLSGTVRRAWCVRAGCFGSRWGVSRRGCHTVGSDGAARTKWLGRDPMPEGVGSRGRCAQSRCSRALPFEDGAVLVCGAAKRGWLGVVARWERMVQVARAHQGWLLPRTSRVLSPLDPFQTM